MTYPKIDVNYDMNFVSADIIRNATWSFDVTTKKNENETLKEIADSVSDKFKMTHKSTSKENKMDHIDFVIRTGTVPEGHVAKIMLGQVRIWEGTTVHDSADEALKEGRKLLMTRMAKLFE